MISFCWSRSQDVYLASSCILPFRLGRSFQVCYWPSEKGLIVSGNPRPCWPTESVRVHKKCDIAKWKCSPSGEVAEVGVHGRTVLFFSVYFFLQSRWWSRWLLQTLRELQALKNESNTEAVIALHHVHGFHGILDLRRKKGWTLWQHGNFL